MGDEIPPAEKILATLNKNHPRLLATAKDFERLKQRVVSDPQSKQWLAELRQQADAILQQPASRYEIPDGKRLLATSRRVLDRVTTLGLLYRLDGDRRYANRAWLELEAAAKFKDWNPSHFLDTAEMTHAFAIGYDWLYDVWTFQQRDTLRRAIVEMGLHQALPIYRKQQWWTVAHHNWNQVCNGGIGMGALAIADEQPELAGEILHSAVASLPRALAEYAPDGAWNEGPGYWHYATFYTVSFIAALESALGTDFGLSKSPGFSQTGLFPLYMSGPTGLSFSFADCHAGRIRAPELFWLARRFRQPAYAGFQLRNTKATPHDLLWFDPAAGSAAPTNLPLDKYYRHVEVATFRSAWDDPKALFVGFKAGDNKANHSHLDLGSFVFDALGERWAVDIGSDDYNLPGYFGGKRWDYYRLRAEGHNTLVINPGKSPDQSPKANAPIVRFKTDPQRAFAIADLTAAYAPHATKVQRGIAMINRQAVLVQDEITAAEPVEVWWFMHTRARIQLAADARSAVLEQRGVKMQAKILAPAGARFEVLPAEPLPTSPHPEKQAGNKDCRKLAVHLPKVTDVRLVVQLSFQPAEVKILPLAEW